MVFVYRFYVFKTNTTVKSNGMNLLSRSVSDRYYDELLWKIITTVLTCNRHKRANGQVYCMNISTTSYCL